MSKSSIAKAYVQILPTTDDLKMNLAKAMNPHLEEAGVSGGKTLGAALSKTLAALGIGKAIKDSLNLGAELQQNLGGAEAVFGSFADSVKEKAKSAFTEMGLSASDYMATANKMASLFQGSGLEQQRSLDLTTKAMQRAADVASVMGIETSAAMESVAGAAKGNFTMMDNLGVAMNATTLAAYALEKGVNFKWETASNAEKAELAMQMFFDRTAQYADNFKRESEETFSGAFGAMKSAAQNVLGNLSLGEDIKPSLDDLLKTVETFAAKNLAPMLGNVMKGIPTIIKSGLSFAIRSLNIAKDNVQMLTAQGTSIAKELATSVISAAPYIAKSAIRLVAEFGRALLETDWAEVATGFISELRKSMNLASGEIFGSDKGIVDAILNAIVEGLPRIANKGFEIVSSLSQGIIKSIPKVTASIGEVMSHVLDAVVEVTQEIPLLVEQFLPMLVKLGSDIVSGLDSGILQNVPSVVSAIGDVTDFILDTLLDVLPELLSNGMKLVGQIASGMVNNIPAIAGAIGEVLGKLLKTIAKHLPELLKAGIDLIAELAVGLVEAIPKILLAIPQIIKSIKDAFKDFDWKSLGSDIMEGIKNGIASGASAIASAAKSAASNALASAKKLLGIHSPSKVFRDEVGKMIGLGMAEGIGDSTRPISEALDDVTSKMTAGLDPITVSGSFDAGSMAQGGSMEQLLALVAGLSAKIDRIEIRLDGDKLVGGISDKMNKALGDQSALEARGVA